jgi:hypothetical protein
MYKIQLTTGMRWDAPILEEHFVKAGIHVVDVERMAQALLNDARRVQRRVGPTSYRIFDAFGGCVRSSATSKPRGTFVRAGRTVWASTRTLIRR